ncbi:energy transducer TonB [Allosphingosinicella deserti]|uniref:Energy transducer TonB n=1 Tax=Allosphingosinicella deserti TaxID=2116704 RepID=A0A2P7QUJ9_9SPHN|nr:energy transducer TonB [Sphingomonas deserti]PSJ41638.1 energy transducer TonB [Sphingomonas deserti]
MAEAAFLQPTKSNSTALTVVIVMHAAALGALALSKMDVIPKPNFGRTTVVNIKDPVKEPPPKPQPKPKTETPQHVSVVTIPPRVIETPVFTNVFQAEPQPTTLAPPVGPVGHIDVPPPPPPLQAPEPKKVEPARGKANLASYVTDADYPAAAIRAEEQGTTRFLLTVGADGKVASCTVTGSSGSSALDSKTCSIMQKRARFTPAQDSAGNKVGDTVSNAIRWVLPE